MKTLNLFLMFVVMVASTVSHAVPGQARASAVKEQYQEAFMAMTGVNGIGITMCNRRTGRSDINAPRASQVACVIVMTESRQAQAALEALYGESTKLQGVIFTFEHRGAIRPQPAVTIHN